MAKLPHLTGRELAKIVEKLGFKFRHQRGSHMIYEHEVRHLDKVEYKGYALLPFITVNFIILVALSFLMAYGPRSLLFGYAFSKPLEKP